MEIYMARKKKTKEFYDYTDQIKDQIEIQKDDQYTQSDQALQDILSQFDKTKTKTKKKRQYYVKKQQLLQQISKYQESKNNSSDRTRIYFRKAWLDDIKDLYKVFITSKILWIFLQVGNGC